MVKLSPTQIAALDPDFIELVAKAIEVEPTTLSTQMVMYATSGSGVVFVDQAEKPSFLVFAMCGSYKADGGRVCVILGVYGSHPNIKNAALAIKQFAKENQCEKVGCGTFSGDSDDKLWEHFNTDETQTVKFHKL